MLAAFGLSCIAVWLRRDGRRTAGLLTFAGLLAFAISHVLGLVIGAWPAVLVVAAAHRGPVLAGVGLPSRRRSRQGRKLQPARRERRSVRVGQVRSPEGRTWTCVERATTSSTTRVRA